MSNDPTQNNLSLALLDQNVAGHYRDRKVAYTAVPIDGGAGWGLGVAELGEPGYWPVPGSIFATNDHKKASEVARGMNEHIGLSPDEAVNIIISSMRQGVV